jgi:hypothetical protein
MKTIGKISFFGGPNDKDMKHDEGLAYYEHNEADLRPDLFVPRGTDPNEGTSKRLRSTQACYIALRMTGGREKLRDSLWKVTNPKTGQFVIASLVDWGPAESTGRSADVSDAIGRSLRVQTDDELEIELLKI